MKRSKRKQRKVRRRILILCESLTEKNYFQAIKEDPDFKQALLAIYQKAKQNDFVNLKDKLSNAFENTNWLKGLADDLNKHRTDHNPWTDVDVLVNELIQSHT